MIAPYRIHGWAQGKEKGYGRCIFGFEIDAEFAKTAMARGTENRDALAKSMRLAANGEQGNFRVSFLSDEGVMLRSVTIDGMKCTCMGLDGMNHDPKKWERTVMLSGHNIDTRTEAYELLAALIRWADLVQHLIEK